MKSSKIITFKRKQPEKCKSCVWGEWTGTKQFCSRVICQRPIENKVEVIRDVRGIATPLVKLI